MTQPAEMIKRTQVTQLPLKAQAPQMNKLD